MNSNDEILNRSTEWDLLGRSPVPISAHSVHKHIRTPIPLSNISYQFHGTLKFVTNSILHILAYI
jgi:hypothetical protein